MQYTRRGCALGYVLMLFRQLPERFNPKGVPMKPITVAALAAVLFATPALAGEHHDRFLKRIDTNSDGSISKAEHQAFSDKKFEKMDANKDGKISTEEQQAMREKWQAQRA